MKTADINVNVKLADLEVVANLLEFCWHDRICAAVDADGEWRKGNPPCSCGYDEAVEALERA